MLITIGHKTRIDQQNAANMIHVTAATRDQVFAHIIDDPYGEINKVWYANSQTRWHNKRDKDDAIAELCAYLVKWTGDTLVNLFNSSRFNFYLVKYFQNNMSMNNDSAWNLKYNEHRGQYHIKSFEIDDPNNFDDRDLKQAHQEEEHQGGLSLMQFVKICKHVLNSREAQEKFTEQDRQFYLDNFIMPHSTGKWPSVKSVAIAKGLNYKHTLYLMRPIKAYVKSYVKFYL